MVGAVLAQTAAKHRDLAKAAVAGALAGMAADLDVLVRSPADPLLVLEYHRQFSHSIAFILVGAVLCSGLLFCILGRRWQLSYRQTLLWCGLGFATHGLLDACTSYGTQLFWPISEARISWDIISVVDPLFTLPLFFCVVAALSLRSRRYVMAALIWGAIYLFVAFVQHSRAMQLGLELAQARGHTVVRLQVKPSFANIVVWKVIYATEDEFFVSAVRPGWQKPRLWSGGSVKKLDVARDFPWLNPSSQQARDVERFQQFSTGFTALDTTSGIRVVDVRYSLLPHVIAPLWGISLTPDAGPDAHVSFFTQRDGEREALAQIWSMIVASNGFETDVKAQR